MGSEKISKFPVPQLRDKISRSPNPKNILPLPAATDPSFPTGQPSFPLPPEIQRVVLNNRGFRQHLFQNLLFTSGQLVKVDTQHIKNNLPDFRQVAAGSFQRLLYFQSHLPGEGKSGVLSISCSGAFRMSWRMAYHVLWVIWQKKSSSSTCAASRVSGQTLWTVPITCQNDLKRRRNPTKWNLNL